MRRIVVEIAGAGWSLATTSVDARADDGRIAVGHDEREIDRFFGGLVERREVHVVDDADDREPRSVDALMDAMAERPTGSSSSAGRTTCSRPPRAPGARGSCVPIVRPVRIGMRIVENQLLDTLLTLCTGGTVFGAA